MVLAVVLLVVVMALCVAVGWLKARGDDDISCFFVGLIIVGMMCLVLPVIDSVSAGVPASYSNDISGVDANGSYKVLAIVQHDGTPLVVAVDLGDNSVHFYKLDPKKPLPAGTPYFKVVKNNDVLELVPTPAP